MSRFRDRLALSLVVLFFAIFVVIFVSVRWVGEMNAQAKAEEEFVASSQGFRTLLNLKQEQLRLRAHIATGDFAFLKLVGTKDYESVEGAFDTYIRRTGADFLAVTDEEGVVRVSNKKASSLQSQVDSAIKNLDENDLDSAILRLDVPHEIVVLPIVVQDLLGFLIAGYVVDEKLMDELAILSKMNVSLVEDKGEDLEFLVHSEKAPRKSSVASQEDQKVFNVNTKEDTYISYLTPYSSDETVKILLQKSMNEELRALRVLNFWLFVIFGVALCFVILMSIFLAQGVSKPIEELGAMAGKIAQGDFKSRTEVQRKDELGRLSSDLNKMAEDLEVYISKTIETTRMAAELEVAKLVQTKLLPQKGEIFGDVSIEGKSEAASECGGDFWFYQEKEDEIFFWVADVTGHGVASAIVTATLRAAASYLESQNHVSLPEIVSLLNDSIYDCTHGDLGATLFIMGVHKKTLKYRYINASHNPVMAFSKEFEGRHNLAVLNSISGGRLGIHREKSFEQFEGVLPKGSALLFYTDGIVEILNPDDKIFGNMRLVRTFHKVWMADSTCEECLEKVWHSGIKFAKGRPLDDDVTIMIAQF